MGRQSELTKSRKDGGAPIVRAAPSLAPVTETRRRPVPDERLLVRIHLCMALPELNQVRTAVRLLSQLPGETVLSEVSDELVPRFKAHKEF